MKENLKIYIADESLDMIHAMKEELRKHSVYHVMGNACIYCILIVFIYIAI